MWREYVVFGHSARARAQPRACGEATTSNAEIEESAESKPNLCVLCGLRADRFFVMAVSYVVSGLEPDRVG